MEKSLTACLVVVAGSVGATRLNFPPHSITVLKE
jgi:hypothetical protein